MFNIHSSVAIIGKNVLLDSAFKSLNVDIVDIKSDYDILISLNQSIKDNEHYQKRCNENKASLIVSYLNLDEMKFIFDIDNSSSELYFSLDNNKTDYQTMHFRDAFIIDQVTRYLTKNKVVNDYHHLFPKLINKHPKVNVHGNNLIHIYLAEHLEKLNIKVTDEDYNVLCSVYDSDPDRDSMSTLAIQKQMELIQGSVVRFNGNVQYMIPHKTNVYEEDTYEIFRPPMLCVIMNHPSEKEHIVPWVEMEVKNMYAIEITSFDDCVQESLNLWYKLFYDPIKLLLELHPKEDIYWLAHKMPALLDFDNENELNNMFIKSTIELLCDLNDIEIKKYDIDKFGRVKHDADELKLVKFDPTIEYMTMLCNMRAKTFGVKKLSESDVKMIINKIIPKTIGMIHMVCSLIGFELLSEDHSNYHIKESIEQYDLTKPELYSVKDTKYNTWDKLSFDGTLRLKKFIEKIREKFCLREYDEVMVMYHTKDNKDRCIYGLNKSEDNKRIKKSLKRILGKIEGELSGKSIVLDVLVNDYDLPLIECSFV